MLEELRFVQGAVGRRNFVPVLTHYRIKDSCITSYNGTIAISCPIACDIDCMPKAESFFKAIQNCDDTVSMHLTKANRLAIKSGNFRVFVDCISEPVMDIIPEGEFAKEFDGETLINAFATVAPFIGSDASRPWATGALVSGTSVFATNNVILVECFTASDFPFLCNIPGATVKELLRIKQIPTAVQASETSLTFHYENGAWIKTQLYSTKWPDASLLFCSEPKLALLDERLWPALETLQHFTESSERVFITSDGISTSQAEGEGASVELPDFPMAGVYNIEMLQLLKDVAELGDFSLYPAPCYFQKDNLRGVIIGMRQ